MLADDVVNCCRSEEEVEAELKEMKICAGEERLKASRCKTEYQ